MIGRGVLGREVVDAREQVLEPHQRADALVQRMLVADHGRSSRPSSASARHSPGNGRGGSRPPRALRDSMRIEARDLRRDGVATVRCCR